LTSNDRRFNASHDRRRVPRGGRREYDRPGRHPTVLVADSYEDARSPIVRYLDRFGFDVVEASNADEAAGVVGRRRPKAVLSGLRGSEASRFFAILSDPVDAPRILIVMLSGNDETVPIRASAVLTKPFSLRPMLDELRQALRENVVDPLGGA
jgi:DNA-binding NtrC family response regulator